MESNEPRTAVEWAVFYPDHQMEERLQQLSPEHRKNILSKSQDSWSGNPRHLDKTFKNADFEKLPDDTNQTKFICRPSSLEGDIILMGDMKPKGKMGKKNKTPPVVKEPKAKRMKEELPTIEPMPETTEMMAVEDDEEVPVVKEKKSALPRLIVQQFDDMMDSGDDEDDFSGLEDNSVEERPKRESRAIKAPPRFADEQSEVEDSSQDGKPKKKTKTKKSKKDTPVKKFSPADERIFASFDGGLLPVWIENYQPIQKLMTKTKKDKTALQPEPYQDIYFKLDTGAYRPFETKEFRVWKALQQRAGWSRLPKTKLTVVPPIDETIFHTWLAEIREHCLKVVPKLPICQHQDEQDEPDEVEDNEDRQFPEYGDQVPVLVLVLHYNVMEWAAAKKSTEVLVRLSHPDNDRLSEERCLKVKVGTFVQMRSLWYTMNPFDLMEDVAANRIRVLLQNGISEDNVLQKWATDDIYLKEVSIESFKIWWFYQCFYRCNTITKFVEKTNFEIPKLKMSFGRPVVYANK